MSKWPINAVDAGYIDETQPTLDQSDGLQRFITDCADGHGELPCAVTAKKQIIVPPCQRIVIEGLNGRPGPGYLAGPSKITAGVEIAPDSPPHRVYLIDASLCARAEFEGIAMKVGDYQGFKAVGGVCPTRMGGIRFGGSYRTSRMSIEGFSTEVGLGGGITGGEPNTTGFDHSKMEGCYLDGGLFAVNLLPYSNTAGDMSFEDCDFYGKGASFGLAKSASSGLVGCTFLRSGSYGPFAFNAYQDGSGQSGGQFSSNNLNGFSAEFGYDGVYFDDGYNAANGSAFGDNIWGPGYYISPQRNVQGWGQTMSVVAGSTQGNTVQVVPPPGFVFKPGLMTVADAADPFGTILATILTNDGSWPYATIPAGKTANSAVPVPVTLTLDKPIDPLITSLKINHVKLATIVAGGISNETVGGSLMRQATGYPVYLSGRTTTHSCKISDGITAIVMARVTPLVAGKVGAGMVWGDRDICGETRQMGTAACVAGDLLQSAPKDTANDKGDFVLPADGTRKPMGLAVLGAAASGVVDLQKSCSKQAKATFNNKSSSVIPANALLKPDPFNKGGTVAASPGDPFVFGVNDSHDVAPLAQGHPAELWF